MSEYDFEISHRPDFAFLTVKLATGQQIQAEPSAMASMDSTIKLKSALKGGLLKSVGRAFGGESMIMNTFTAEEAGEVTFAPGPMGDCMHYPVSAAGGIMLQRGAYVASSPGVEVNGKWAGFKGFFSEGMVLLKATGEGDLFFNTYGAIVEVDVSDNYYVDNNYVVAFEDTLDYRITALPGLKTGSRIKSFLFGGEGLVCEFQGQGKIWIQTRTVAQFVNWIHPYRPQSNNN